MTTAKSRCSFQMSCGVGTQTQRQHQDEGSWRSPEMEEKMNE